MKRSQINTVYRQAKACFEANGWTLPPNPKWDITDFGLGEFDKKGLVLINLAEESEYCEKLIYARKNQVTVAHAHKQKKEDIICRTGELILQVWGGHPEEVDQESSVTIRVCGDPRQVKNGGLITLNAGERVTLVPGVYHAFWPGTDECVIGEVSTANDDLNDNFFVDKTIGRFPGIEEDEASEIRLISE
ncbi:MAG: D-lyxose/D-mannose family sugar isomerase [Verrucomicrobia bacterium]|nr:D-lyxose/D-mannose family sugar isomerase [Verrucomicrobiota bacterium]